MTHPRHPVRRAGSALVAAAIALSLLPAGLARAQGNRDDRGPGRADQGQRGGPPASHGYPGNRDDRSQRGNRDDRGPGNGRGGYQPPGHQADNRQWYGPGAERGPGFRRGDRLPQAYRSRQYVVDDWRGHHLSAPPRGYHWVQNGGEYLLVAIATGVILQLLLDR